MTSLLRTLARACAGLSNSHATRDGYIIKRKLHTYTHSTLPVNDADTDADAAFAAMLLLHAVEQYLGSIDTWPSLSYSAYSLKHLHHPSSSIGRFLCWQWRTSNTGF